MKHRMVLTTGLFLTFSLTALGRAPSAQDLIDEFRDSQLILGELHSTITAALRREVAGRGDATEMEKALHHFVQTADEHTASFDGLKLGSRPALTDLNEGYIGFLRWRSKEVPRAARDALVTWRSIKGESARRKAMEDELLSAVRREGRWLEELAGLERSAMADAIEGLVGHDASDPPGRHAAWLLLFPGSSVVVALLLWCFLQKRRRGSRAG